MSNTSAITAQYQNYFNVDMHYRHGSNNNQIGKNRRRLTMTVVARFGHTSPMIIRWLYGISQAQALVHLNKLCQEGLLDFTQTHRSPDDRVYVLTRAGALYTEQLTGIQLHFRSSEQVSQRINLATLYHDLIVQYVILRGMTELHFQNADSFDGWDGFVTDAEFRKIARKFDVRSVDAIVREPSGTLCAVEFEHSFKAPENRKGILLKYSQGLEMECYDKVMLFSQKMDILKDARRINENAIDYLTTHTKPKTNDAWLTENNAQQLKAALVYRTKFCDELAERFYR